MASMLLDTVLLPYFLVLPGICFGFVPDPMMVQVEPLLQEKVGNYTTIHPRNLPRRTMSLPAHPWTGPTHDDLPDALMHALTNGFAVLADANAMFRVTKTKNHGDDDSSFTAQWFQNLRSRPDTTTIPHKSWLPRDTHHDFARHLHKYLQHATNIFEGINNDDENKKESYAGILSIGGARRRGDGTAPNLSFPHQDECKFSVLVGECAAAIGDSENTSLHPLQDLVDDTVSNQVREAVDQTLEVFRQNATNHLFPKATCRQINFWCPHQENGDKYLVVMSRQVSQAVVEANFVTTCQLGVGTHCAWVWVWRVWVCGLPNPL